MLIDSVVVDLQAGRGGNGIVSWRREKFISKGGPDGGDGGHGGSIILKSSSNLDTLSGFRYKKLFNAEEGKSGSSKKRTGHSGEDLVLLVPIGTRVTDEEDNQEVIDLQDEGKEYIICKGGKGGYGNTRFAHATRQNPMFATDGKPGEKKTVKLELDLIADIALVGPPNAGKSSLITKITGVKSKIGDYPFSTTNPILGVLKDRKKKLILIDLPGLIEGSHKGKGLGDTFLQHTKRVKALIYILDATYDPLKQLEDLRKELDEYHEGLSIVSHLIVVNKIDLIDSKVLKEIKSKFSSAIYISLKDNININTLKREIVQLGIDKS